MAYTKILIVLDAAKKRNLFACLHNGTPEYAQKMGENVCNLLTEGAESRYISAVAKTYLQKLKSFKGSQSKGY